MVSYLPPPLYRCVLIIISVWYFSCKMHGIRVLNHRIIRPECCPCTWISNTSLIIIQKHVGVIQLGRWWCQALCFFYNKAIIRKAQTPDKMLTNNISRPNWLIMSFISCLGTGAPPAAQARRELVSYSACEAASRMSTYMAGVPYSQSHLRRAENDS